MPDLDDELAALRDTLRTSVSLPELSAVVQKSRQRSSRRRRQLGAVAAVLVVGATIPLLRTALRPIDDPYATPAAPPTSIGTVGPSRPGPFVYSVGFADDRHGYALRGGCGPENNAECTSELLVTEDAQNWRVRKLPPAIGRTTGSVIGQLYVFDSRTLLVGEISTPSGLRFFSADAGQTWQEVRATDDELIDTIPAGASLEFTCDTGNDCPGKLIVLRPDTGRTASLRTPPPLTKPLPAATVPVDGAWWVSGIDPAGQQVLAASRDAGVTWLTAALPGLPPKQRHWVDVTGTDSTLYATVLGELPNVKNGLLAIYRSTDGGKSWERTWQAATGREPSSTTGATVAAADGSLVVHADGGQPYLSDDGGRTFQLRSGAPVGYVRFTRAGYLLTPPSPTSTACLLSRDGVQWREITVG